MYKLHIYLFFFNCLITFDWYLVILFICIYIIHGFDIKKEILINYILFYYKQPNFQL